MHQTNPFRLFNILLVLLRLSWRVQMDSCLLTGGDNLIWEVGRVGDRTVVVAVLTFEGLGAFIRGINLVGVKLRDLVIS